ncbi:MAG: hypothetical protein PHV28_03020 [Kiritimatiellae bacterium]|nr:hypothetical protein [Kiritimatiellia bacterium]
MPIIGIASLRGGLGHVFAVCLFSLTTHVSAAPPALRHMNYVAVYPDGKTNGEISVLCKSRGPQFQDLLRCRLFDSGGGAVAVSKAAPGQTLTMAVPSGAGDRMALEVASGQNAAEAHFPEDLPWALVARADQPLKTVGEWGPLSFFVPAGTAKATFWIQAGAPREAAHLVVRAPDGSVALDREGDFDERTKIECPVPAGHADKTWSVSLERCARKGWYTDDVTLELGGKLPGLLSPRPEWAAQFSRNRRSAGKPRVPSAKLAAQPATRPAYRPLANDALADAFTRRGGTQWRTSLPFTYVLDYGTNHVGSSNYIAAVASAPPTLLHLGKDVPFNHGWGPVRSFGGENVAHGSGDAIARLSPDAVAARITALRQMVDSLHAAGVRYVTPYICSMTLNGDPVKRSGFWEFYDHWDEYRCLGLARRPGQDPREWLQTKPDGKPRLYYTYDQSDFYPAFKTNHRFAACWQTEGWRTWLLEVVRFAARTGCDGVFVDNGRSQKSFSPAALAAFRLYLKSRYNATQSRDLLGISDLDAAVFPDDRAATLAAYELRRFWCATTREQMAAIKAAGSQTLGREFVVFPNGGNAAELQEGLRDTDFVMFEKSSGPYGTNPGLVLQPIFDGVSLRAINDNLFEYLFVRSLRARVRPVILTRGGYPRTLPHLDMNPDSARLGMAECAAFSGGGGFLLRPRFDIYHDGLNDYREFTESHPELYAGLLPWADAVILALPEQEWLGNRAHLAAIKRLTPVIADARVRFEFVSESRLDAAPYAEARVVAAYNVSVLADPHLQALARFVMGGGTLLVSGPLAEKDAFLRPRATLPTPLDQLAGLADGLTVTAGKGRLARRESEETFATFLGQSGVTLTRAGSASAEGIRLATYRSPDRCRLVVHAVNYLTPLGVDAPPVEEAKDVCIHLPLPAGQRLAGFRVLSPDCSTPDAARATEEVNAIILRIPRLRIYAVAELTLDAATKKR